MKLQHYKTAGVKQLTVKDKVAVGVNPYHHESDEFYRFEAPPLSCPSIPDGTYDIGQFEEQPQWYNRTHRKWMVDEDIDESRKLRLDTRTVLVLKEPVAESEKPKSKFAKLINTDAQDIGNDFSSAKEFLTQEGVDVDSLISDGLKRIKELQAEPVAEKPEGFKCQYCGDPSELTPEGKEINCCMVCLPLHYRVKEDEVAEKPEVESPNNLPDIEMVAAKVHDAWWDAKAENGFHAPVDCRSENRLSYARSSQQGRDRFDDNFDQRFYKWCDKCHPDMYPYEDLSETVKDYDRTTVKAVYSAIDDLSSLPRKTAPETLKDMRKSNLLKLHDKIYPSPPEAEPAESAEETDKAMWSILQKHSRHHALVYENDVVTVRSAISAMEEYADIKAKEASGK